MYLVALFLLVSVVSLALCLRYFVTNACKGDNTVLIRFSATHGSRHPLGDLAGTLWTLGETAVIGGITDPWLSPS